MKLQHLIIVFLVIMLPMALIMSQYTGLQIDTLATKTKYDTALLGATFDTMAAFELNTINGNKSSVIGEEIRDLEAVISTFSTSLSSSMGLSGVSNKYILSYVPALVFGLYDGYYIYSQNDTGTGGELKPYVYYTKTYTKGTNVNITIAYSLDNYVSIYGTYGTNQTISAAGYLVVPDDIVVSADFAYVKTKDENGDVISKVISPGVNSKITYKGYDILPETIYGNKINTSTHEMSTDQSKYTTDAMMYYYEAKQFTDLYNTVIRKLSTDDQEILLIDRDNDPENEESAFMNEKINVMKNSIISNLNNAIYNYEGRASTYEMPQLTGEDWEKILNNISVTAFLKDIPIGTTTYNNYVVVNSTTNQKYNSAKAIDFIEYDNSARMKSKGYYHKITCDELLGNINSNSDIIGYASVEFERYRYTRDNSNDYYYYYKHNEYADYDCEIETIENQNVYTMEKYIQEKRINNRNLDIDIQKKILKSYYTAVGRIRYGLVKASSYINLDDTTKNFTVHYHPEGGKWQDNSAFNTKSIPSTIGKLQIISDEPQKSSKVFEGWSSRQGATEAEAKVGDTIYSDGAQLNLYAVWKDPNP